MLGKKHSEETKKKMSKAMKGIPRSDAFKKFMSEKFKGKDNPARRPEVREKIRQTLLGHKHSEKSKRKMSATRKLMVGKRGTNWKGGCAKCPICGIQKKHSYKVGQLCWKCRNKYCVGEKHPNWKGHQSLNKYLRKTPIYKNWRTAIFERDNYTCVLCREKGGLLEADHIKPFAYLLEVNNIKNYKQAFICKELWNIKNGRTLCKKCHLTTPTWGNQKYEQ